MSRIYQEGLISFDSSSWEDGFVVADDHEVHGFQGVRAKGLCTSRSKIVYPESGHDFGCSRQLDTCRRSDGSIQLLSRARDAHHFG